MPAKHAEDGGKWRFGGRDRDYQHGLRPAAQGDQSLDRSCSCKPWLRLKSLLLVLIFEADYHCVVSGWP